MPTSSPRHPIRKRLVTDEDRRPVAVQIDYADWLEIERRLGLEDRPTGEEGSGQKEQEVPLESLLAASSGIWTEGDGLDYQRRIRSEWDRPWDSPDDGVDG